jgi:hemin uptake protein HemP
MKSNPDACRDASQGRLIPAGQAPDAPRRVRSEELLAGQAELVIEHQGREYRLRITQNGKLILTA